MKDALLPFATFKPFPSLHQNAQNRLEIDHFPIKFQGEELTVGELLTIQDRDNFDQVRLPQAAHSAVKYFWVLSLEGHDLSFEEPLPSDCFETVEKFNNKNALYVPRSEAHFSKQEEARAFSPLLEGLSKKKDLHLYSSVKIIWDVIIKNTSKTISKGLL